MTTQPPSTATSRDELVRSYRPLANRYDEMLDTGGLPRPHWQKLMAMIERLGPTEVSRRWEEARQLLHEHGVSYNVYGDPRGMTRPWSLSPLPIVLPSTEWQELGRGLSQRARLLDLLLEDLHGEQRLLLEGDIPAELLFEHPGFLRPAHGLVPPQGHWLPLYAADVIRGPEGTFEVLTDRTQAPSGAGYSLENRMVISRALPDVFRGCNVTRLASFFRGMRDTLAGLAFHNRDNPRVVLLTPGPFNASYFEHAFLAQYLGHTLAQGADLTVRDGKVYLKALGGLQQVDVVLRRLNDDYCDPLELRADSSLGVPGLLQAARLGNVAIVNPLGSGLAQSPALLPFLPRICRKLLDEDLLLPSVETFWCGDPKLLSFTLEHLQALVIKPAFPGGPTEPIFPQSMSQVELADLRSRIGREPRRFLAQRAVALSTTPLLTPSGLEPRAWVLRAYLAAKGSRSEGEYHVMPGGLARTAGHPQALQVSMQQGGGSKDVWVLSGGPANTFSLLRSPAHEVPISREGGDLPSRVADDLYWLGRYAERSEGLARLAREIGARLSDQNGVTDGDGAAEVMVLLRALDKGVASGAAPATVGRGSPVAGDGGASWQAMVEARLLAAVFDEKTPGTLQSTIVETHRAARIVRDRISGDTFRALAQLQHDMGPPHPTEGSASVSSLMNQLNRVVLTLAAFSGLSTDSMTRGQAWRFLDMGRRLERAVNVVHLLRVCFDHPSEREGQLLESMLQVADSSMTYRRRYLATLERAPVVDLLLTDESNPRSALFQFLALASHIDELPREPNAVPRTPQEKIALSALSELRLVEIGDLCRPDAAGNLPALTAFLDRLAILLRSLSDSLSGGYLKHTTPSRHLSQAGLWLE